MLFKLRKRIYHPDATTFPSRRVLSLLTPQVDHDGEEVRFSTDEKTGEESSKYRLDTQYLDVYVEEQDQGVGSYRGTFGQLGKSIINLYTPALTLIIK